MRRISSVFLIILLYYLEGLTQPANIIHLPNQNSNSSFTNSYPVLLSNSEVMVFYQEDYYNIYAMKSTTSGSSWQTPSVINTGIDIPFTSGIGFNLNAIRLNNGRIFLSWRESDQRNYFIFSDDNGLSWSSKQYLITGTNALSSVKTPFGYFYQTGNNQLVYTFSDTTNRTQSIYFITSPGGDANWTSRKPIAIDLTKKKVFEISLTSINATNWICSFGCYDSLTSRRSIYFTQSSDEGNNWTNPTVLLNTSESIISHRMVRKPTGELYLIYRTITDSIPVANYQYYNYDIVYRISSNNGQSWSDKTLFTKYAGNDYYFNVNMKEDKIAVSFNSERGERYSNYTNDNITSFYGYSQLHYGLLGETRDDSPPPLLLQTEVFPAITGNSPFAIRVHAIANPNTKIIAKCSFNGTNNFDVNIYDDGNHNDLLAGDNVYGAVLGGLVNPIGSNNYFFEYKIKASSSNSEATTESIRLDLLPDIIGETTLFDINRFWVPIDNKGVIADAQINGKEGGYYDDNIVLFSGGFFLSGYTYGALWANGVASASRIADYTNGRVGDQNSIGKIFTLRSSDVPFGDSWQIWKIAVSEGAKFYDGDHDGIYNPVDKNSNGIWDNNEDRPDLIGDFTAWTLFNDGTPSELRRFSDVQPQGIEVQQTVFGWQDTGNPLENVFFVRYKIENKSTVYQVMDSVYFGMWADPDIGDAYNDLSGCDTILNANLVYNSGTDATWGSNPPAFLMDFIQGPYSFIPGVTFIDNNVDGQYTAQTDFSLDTAYHYRGQHLGIEKIPGAKNLGISSFVSYIQSHPEVGDPNNKQMIRNYMLGKDAGGYPLDPCSWPYGVVLDVPCNNVNNVFWYSGDPVTGRGWLCNYYTDQRIMGNTGPFKLERNKPVEIIVAYIAGQGSDWINSITVAKTYDMVAQILCDNNFNKSTTPASKGERPVNNELNDNYPNPFNPLTNISFNLSKSTKVSLKVYDILGKTIAILVDQQMSEGNHVVKFDGSRLASGIYFYELNTGEYRSLKKMMIIK